MPNPLSTKFRSFDPRVGLALNLGVMCMYLNVIETLREIRTEYDSAQVIQ